MNPHASRSGRFSALADLSATNYRPHAMHSEQAVWVEKNCYVDVWIELLHALKLEPAAAMAFTLTTDFEGDHCTFFKPPHTDLRTLYGIDVQELNIWRPLIDHAAEYLGAGKLISTEADSFWLPDTAGTDYQRHHVKTTILLNDLDVDQQRLGYFHSAGYHQLLGEDFLQLFQRDAGEGVLPLYAELIRIDRLQRRPAQELADVSYQLLCQYMAWRPTSNPVPRFAARLNTDLSQLHAQGLAHYHAWAFTTLRQLGAAFELASNHLRWLAPHGHANLLAAAERFDVIAQDSKSLILKLARVVNGKRAFDAAEAFAPMAQAWDDGMGLLARAVAE
ncbi:MAG: DUF1839 family protein [Cytophagales bacterium]|nr:DUF1839 family protein [Rhizobacter sp.]